MRAQHLCVAAMAALVATTSALASVEINGNPTKNMTCTAGICSSTAKSAVLNTTDLANMLAAGDVTVTTGNGAVTITVSGPFSWTSTHRLTLDANLNVSFRAPVEVAGQGAVTIVTNDGGTGGDLIFFPGGKLDFWDTGSSLIINGRSHTLANSLSQLADDFEQSRVSVALVQDYDASRDIFNSSPIHTLDGTFEGLGHTIKDLTINFTGHDNCVGLIFVSTYRSTIRDIRLLNVKVSTTQNDKWIGTIEGCGGAEIVNSSSQGTATGPASSFIGGIAGTSDAIVNSSADVNVSAVSGSLDKYIPEAGGLIGFGSTIVNSHATGSVTGRGLVGGLAGEVSYSVTNSYAAGPVTTGGGDAERPCARRRVKHTRSVAAGGLVGLMSGNVASSFVSGAVTGGQNAIVGGLSGEDSPLNPSTIEDSYSTGSVQGGAKACIGGLSGRAGAIRTSYASGLVSGSAPETAGGLLAVDDSTGPKIQDYWDLDTSGISDPSQGAGNIPNDPGITGLTDEQMKSELPAGFDPKIWAHNSKINNGYPYLIANPPPQ